MNKAQKEYGETLAGHLDRMQCQVNTAPIRSVQKCGTRGKKKQHQNDYNGLDAHLIGVERRTYDTPDGELVRARFTGTLQCHSNSGFCNCSEEAARNNRRRLLRMMRKWVRDGKHLYFLTLTMRHETKHSLDELDDSRSAGHYEVTNGYPWRKDKQDFAIAGKVSLIEATIGESGWHPHEHIVLFVENELDEEKQRALEDRIFERWVKGVMSTGLFKMAPSRGRGIDLEHIVCDERLADLADYAVKNQLVGASYEMTNSDQKEGRKDGEAIQELREKHYRAWLANGRYARHLKMGEVVVMDGTGAGRNFYVEQPRKGERAKRRDIAIDIKLLQGRKKGLQRPVSAQPDDDDLDDSTFEWNDYLKLEGEIGRKMELAELAFETAGKQPVFRDDAGYFIEGKAQRKRLFVPDDSKDYFEYCLVYKGKAMISFDYGTKRPETKLEHDWNWLLLHGEQSVDFAAPVLPLEVEEYADAHEGVFEEEEEPFESACTLISQKTPAFIFEKSFRKRLNGKMARQRKLLSAMTIGLDEFEKVASKLGVTYITQDELTWIFYGDHDLRKPGNQKAKFKIVRAAMPEILRMRQKRLLSAYRLGYQGRSLLDSSDESDERKNRRPPKRLGADGDASNETRRKNTPLPVASASLTRPVRSSSEAL